MNAGPAAPPIRVLIVDDSTVVRRTLTAELSRYADIEVIGSAGDPYEARERIVELQPDVITLDIEMPRMNGLAFLARLMMHYPMPVVIVSSLTRERGDLALQALELGAVDVVCKPGSGHAAPDVHGRLVHAIRAAAVARLRPHVAEPKSRVGEARDGAPEDPPADPTAWRPQRCRVIALGASTGGTHAIEQVLRGLPADAPPTLIVQHMPEHFTASFAARLDAACPMRVREARDMDHLETGLALVAAGNQHMLLAQDRDNWHVRVKGGPPVHHQRPSVDVLFGSVAHLAGGRAVGVLLTGMGADGARGLLQMHVSGAPTIVQDEATCAVFGMPREAIRLGGADDVVALPRISACILRALSGPPRLTDVSMSR